VSAVLLRTIFAGMVVEVMGDTVAAQQQELMIFLNHE